MISTGTIVATSKINEEDFIKTNKNYVTIESNKTTPEEYQKYSEMDGVKYLLPGSSNINMRIPLYDYYQTSNQNMLLKGSLSSINMISEKDLIYGRMPESDQEIVVDKLTIEKMYSSSNDTNTMVNIKILKMS